MKVLALLWTPVICTNIVYQNLLIKTQTCFLFSPYERCVVCSCFLGLVFSSLQTFRCLTRAQVKWTHRKNSLQTHLSSFHIKSSKKNNKMSKTGLDICRTRWHKTKEHLVSGIINRYNPGGTIRCLYCIYMVTNKVLDLGQRFEQNLNTANSTGYKWLHIFLTIYSRCFVHWGHFIVTYSITFHSYTTQENKKKRMCNFCSKLSLTAY